MQRPDWPLFVQAIKQMDTINRQTDELARLRDALAERETAIAVAQADNSELQLRASTTKQHCIMFSDAWIVETTHHRLKGSLPLDREGASLVAVPGVMLAVLPIDASFSTETAPYIATIHCSSAQWC